MCGIVKGGNCTKETLVLNNLSLKISYKDVYSESIDAWKQKKMKNVWLCSMQHKSRRLFATKPFKNLSVTQKRFNQS